MLITESQAPIRSLVLSFVSWKLLLLAIALGSGVGPAYDTSTTLVSPATVSSEESLLDLPTKLSRWDAIYFLQVSRRWYLFEQEWAFGSGLPVVISYLKQIITAAGVQPSDSLEPWIGICVAHTSHLLAVLTLYQLGQVIWPGQRLPFTAALLHIMSPAGLFLSAPYAESTYAFLSFLGYLFFAKAVLGKSRNVAHDVSIVMSGVWFGLATTFRSNGLLNGMFFLTELIRELFNPPTLASVRRRFALILGGAAVAVGFVVPQLAAYVAFCYQPDNILRPWCTKMPFSIFSFVQEKYWNVGFIRYWTVPNIPLFLLAAPVLYLLLRSGFECIKDPNHAMGFNNAAWTASSEFVQVMAFSQQVLAVLAITNYHVQIITRISSGYPLWYFWLAAVLQDKNQAKFGASVVMFMVMYGTIQGALFASFLPPA